MTFDELRQRIWDEKQNTIEVCIDRLEELTPFQQGIYRGEIIAYDEILNIMRGIEKWGDLE